MTFWLRIVRITELMSSIRDKLCWLMFVASLNRSQFVTAYLFPLDIAICDIKAITRCSNEPIANCDRFKAQLEVPIGNLKFSNFSAPKPVVGDSVNQSQSVTGWLPESRSHFATLNSGEDLVPDGAKGIKGSGWRQRFRSSPDGAAGYGGGFHSRKLSELNTVLRPVKVGPDKLRRGNGS